MVENAEVFDLRAYALHTQELMDEYRHAYSTLTLDRSERNYVAATLLASSLDTLWSCATLVASVGKESNLKAMHGDGWAVGTFCSSLP